MSRTVVRVGAFLLVLPLALMSIRAFGGDPPKKPPASDDPFDDEKPAVTKKPEAPPRGGTPARLHGGEKAILKALRQKASLNFADKPLKDVLDYVSREHHIPILFDAAGLKDAGVDPDTQITCIVSGISLQSALEIMLDELQLKWVIHHKVLLITSPTKAESDEYMETKLYDARTS
jgi:hypothetical protein